MKCTLLSYSNLNRVLRSELWLPFIKQKDTKTNTKHTIIKTISLGLGNP